MIVDVCPKCGCELRWELRGTREAGFCECNPAGPVIERDVQTEESEIGQVGVELFDLPGVNREIVGALVAYGFTTIEQVKNASDEELLAVSGIGPARLAAIRGLIK
jgi:hypothetical protein